MKGQHIRHGVVSEGHAGAAFEDALVGAPAHAHRQPHALAALLVGHGAGRVEIHRQVVRLARGHERVGRIPVVGSPERNPGFVHGLPAFLQVALVVDAHGPQAVGAAEVAAAAPETASLLADADLTRVGIAQKAHLLAALVGHLAAAHRRGIVADIVAGLLGDLLYEGFELIHLGAVALVHVVTHVHLEGQLVVAQVGHDALEGRAAAREAARRVVGVAKAVNRDLGAVHAATPQHVGDVLCEQISVRDDGGAVRAATLLRERGQALRERLDDVGSQKRLAAEPCHGDAFGVGGVEHARRQSHDVVLNLGAHLAAPMVLEAVRAIKIATHCGANGEADAVRYPTSSAPHGLERRALVEVRDDAAAREALDDGVVLVELLEDRQEVHLDRRVLGAIALVEVRDRDHLRIGNLRAYVVARHVPAGLACRARGLRFGLLFLGHLALLFRGIRSRR